MSKTWIITRHPGAAAWLAVRGVQGEQVAHLDVARVAVGDTVIGTLPVNLAAEVCALGARYYHLSLRLPSNLRGVELSPEEMDRCGAVLRRYHVQPVGVEG